MADLPDIKREVQKTTGSAPMPPPPSPGNMELPAPAPPSRGTEPTAGPQMPPAHAGMTMPPKKVEPEPKPIRKEPEHAPEMPRPGPHAAAHAEEAVDIHGSPPVFIKIDKYADIVRNIQRLKSTAMNLRDALDALADIEKELTTGIAISHKALDEFNSTIAMLDSRFVRATSMKEIESSESEEIDGYIKGIYEQMDKIKDDLQDIR